MESTIPSYYVARPSRDLVTAAHQQITREWWRKRLEDFDVHISDVVIDEVSLGDPEMARQRLELLKSFPLLSATDAARALTDALVKSGPLPQKAVRDAAHIALSAVHGMDFLLTWNCRHIANAEILRKVEAICARHGVKCPVVCTPGELMGGEIDENNN